LLSGGLFFALFSFDEKFFALKTLLSPISLTHTDKNNIELADKVTVL
jgi:hypothetical protein